MTIEGSVIKKPFARGTKSEHEAVYLVSGQGEFVLRRAGGNPFSDPDLDKLVGRRIRAEGEIVAYTFLMSAWSVA